MSVEKVKEYVEQFGMSDRVLEFDRSSETVDLAAQAVGCEPKQITKTMSFLVEDEPILICLAGDARIANAKYKQEFGTKAKMIYRPSGRGSMSLCHKGGGQGLPG